MLVALLWAVLSVGASALSTYFLSCALGIAVGPTAMAAVMSMVTLVVIIHITSEGYTSRLHSLTNTRCPLLLRKKKHTSQRQSLTTRVGRLLVSTNTSPAPAPPRS